MVLFEKIYIGLWIWFLFISVISFMWTLIFALQAKIEVRTIIIALGSSIETKFFIKLLQKISYSDWFILTLIKKNSEEIFFDSFILELLRIKALKNKHFEEFSEAAQVKIYRSASSQLKTGNSAHVLRGNRIMWQSDVKCNVISNWPMQKKFIKAELIG